MELDMAEDFLVGEEMDFGAGGGVADDLEGGYLDAFWISTGRSTAWPRWNSMKCFCRRGGWSGAATWTGH